MKILILSILLSGLHVNAFAKGWACSYEDADENLYTASDRKGEVAMEKAKKKCKTESPKPKTCSKLWPCIGMLGTSTPANVHLVTSKELLVCELTEGLKKCIAEVETSQQAKRVQSFPMQESPDGSCRVYLDNTEDCLCQKTGRDTYSFNRLNCVKRLSRAGI